MSSLFCVTINIFFGGEIVSESDQDSDTDKTKKEAWQQFWKRVNVSGLWVLLGFGAVLIITVIILAFSTDNIPVRATILAAGIPAVLTFIAVVIQAAVAKQMAEIMENQEIEMTRQREAMVKQSLYIKRQVTAAKIALIQTKHFFEIAERPRIGIETVTMQPVRAYKDISVNIIWRNSGRSSAQILHSIGQIVVFPKEYVTDDKCPILRGVNVRGPVSRPVIPPNSNYSQTVPLDLLPDREYIRDILEGERIIYLWAQVLYGGLKPEPHISQYYARYYPHFDGFGECDEGNLFT